MKHGHSRARRFRVSVWGLLIAAGVVACAATVLGFAGRFAWWLDLFSHFRMQYLLGLVVLGVACLAAQRRWTGAVFLALACANLVPVLPLFFSPEHAVSEGTLPLRAMLINVNTRRGDPQRVREVVEEADPDLLVLEEINTRWVAELAWLANSHPHTCVEPREDNFGIGMFSKLPLVESEIAYVGNAGVPSILAVVDTGQQKVRVLATHPLPPIGPQCARWRNEQLERLPAYVSSPLPVVLLGDLNVTPWNDHFRRLAKRTGLVDSSRGFGFQPSWPTSNLLLSIPLDHCLHSPDISVTGRRIGPAVGSDHYPLIVDLVIGE